MLVWGNPAFRAASAPLWARLAAHRRERLSQAVTFPTVLGLAGISYPGLDTTRDLASAAFVPGRPLAVLAPDGKPRLLQGLGMDGALMTDTQGH